MDCENMNAQCEQVDSSPSDFLRNVNPASLTEW